MTTVAHADNGRDPRGLRPIPRFIFASRWLQLPLYVGLIVAQVVYVYLFLKELIHLVLESPSVTEQQAKLCFARLAHKMPIPVRMIRRRPA